MLGPGPSSRATSMNVDGTFSWNINRQCVASVKTITSTLINYGAHNSNRNKYKIYRFIKDYAIMIKELFEEQYTVGALITD